MTRAVLSLLLLAVPVFSAVPAEDLALLRELRRRGEDDKALELATRLLESDPRDPRVHEAYQDLRLLRGERDALVAEYRARAGRPDAPAADHYLLARVVGGPEGDAELRVALGLDPAHFESLCLLGARLVELGALEEAGVLLQRAWRRNVDSAIPPNQLGWLSERAGDLKRAELLYRESASLDETFLAPRLNLGLLLVGQKRIAEAVEFLEAARNIAPGDPMPLIGLAMARAADGQVADAMGFLEKAGELKGHSASSLNLLGGAYLGLGQYELARAAFGRALRTEPGNVTAILHSAYACLLGGNHEEARAFAEKAIALAPEGAEGHYVLGLSHEAGGQGKAAERCFRRAAELAPAAPQYPRALGTLYAGLGRYLEAVGAWSRAADLSGNAPGDLYGLAFALLGAGDARKAAACFEAVLEKEPANLDALLNLGLVCQDKLRDKARAIAAYETYLAKGGTDPRVPRWLAELKGL